jgi:hypothetical protein
MRLRCADTVERSLNPSRDDDRIRLVRFVGSSPLAPTNPSAIHGLLPLMALPGPAVISSVEAPSIRVRLGVFKGVSASGHA